MVKAGGAQAIAAMAYGTESVPAVDVIVVHRLLKNSVGRSAYVLLTEAAQQDLQLPLILLSKGEETYDGIGAVTTYVCQDFTCGEPLVGAEAAERALGAKT